METQQIVGLAVLGAINLLTFVMMGIDKAKAKRGSRRISEFGLVLPVALGGVVGGLLGMVMFRHKTSKRTFQFKFILASVIGCALWVLIA